MNAIVEINGKQYEISQDQELLVDRMPKDPKKLKIEKILLAWDGSKIKVGEPFLKGAYIEIEVLGDARGKKIEVLKYKSKKRERKKTGFKPAYSKIKIIKITNS